MNFMLCKNFMLVLSQLAVVKTFIIPFQSINLNILVSRRQQVIASGCLGSQILALTASSFQKMT